MEWQGVLVAGLGRDLKREGKERGEEGEGDEWTLEGGIPSVLVIEYCFKGI